MEKPNRFGTFLIALGIATLLSLFRAETLFQKIFTIAGCSTLVISGICVIAKSESKK